MYPSGDITSSLVENNKIIKAKLISNQNAVVGGLSFVKYAFNLIDNKIKFLIKKKDGSSVKKNSLIATIEGRGSEYTNSRKSCFKFFITYFGHCY